MSVNLKLSGIHSYTGKATMIGTESVVVKKGEVCRFTDEIADKIMDGGRRSLEGDWIPYWVEARDDETVNHNFTEDAVKTEVADPKVLLAAAAQQRANPRQRTLIRRR